MFKTIEETKEFVYLNTPFTVSSARNKEKLTPVFSSLNAQEKALDHLSEKLAEQTALELKNFFLWFRENGEKYLNLTIDQMIDKYLEL